MHISRIASSKMTEDAYADFSCDCKQLLCRFVHSSFKLHMKCLSHSIILHVFWWIHIILVFHYHTPWKRQKTDGFLTFSGDIKMEHQCDVVNILGWNCRATGGGYNKRGGKNLSDPKNENTWRNKHYMFI